MEQARVEERYDAVVIGGGHAGCEAALALARRGFSTILFTVSIESIALMPCNPNIGGSSKGHLVREVDALGGEMGKNIDASFLQSKMLNRSKGPAVHSLRAQADKQAYSTRMRRVLEETENLTIRQQEVTALLTEELKNGRAGGARRRVTGVKSVSGAIYRARTVILCTGVYLQSSCIYGDVRTQTGPNGLMHARFLSDSLREAGLSLVRFKTGTPARLDGKSIDYSKMTEQKGDDVVVPFSFSTDPDSVQIPQMSCWLTYTNEETHRIIRENLDRSPLYGGQIHATGPRYCPSIEDKVVKFAEKERHQVFLEPEGRYTNEMYVDGMSSSMPEDVQIAMYRSVPGLEHARIVRYAYAIEYDCLSPGQLKSSLETRAVEGLFSAGQFNGSSGYEEAAAQGIIAGINAGNHMLGKKALVLTRAEAYIGVLIDDLVTKENREPYRMMTSRAEYRLFLRQDNADRRLRKYGYEAGLVSFAEMEALTKKEKEITSEIKRVRETYLPPSGALNRFLAEHKSAPVTDGVCLAELICRPELDYVNLAEVDADRPILSAAVCEQVNIEIKYEGYIRRQERQIAQFAKTEAQRLPDDIDYEAIDSLRIEARQTLSRFRPENIGQARRLSGVTPADIAVFLVWLKDGAKTKKDKSAPQRRDAAGKQEGK